MGSSSSPTSTITSTMITAGRRLSPSSRNGSTLDLPERPKPKELRKPLRNSASAISPPPARAPSYGRYPRSWITPVRGTSGVSGIDEHVLDATVVGLDADQPEAELERGVTHQVV